MNNRHTKPKIGLIVSTLMEDEFNDFTSTRPAALEKLGLLQKILGEMGDVICLGLMENLEDAEKTRKEFQREEVDVIIYTALSYNKGLVATKPLLDNNIPLLIWNTQHLPALPGEADFDQMWTNSGLAGIPDLCNTLIRAERTFEFLTGPMEEASTHDKIRDYLKIALVRRCLKHSTIATIGQAYPGMTDFMIDTFELYQMLGPVALPIDPGVIAEEMEKVNEGDVDALVSDTIERYQVRINDQQTLQHSARLALAMEKAVCRDLKADGVAALDQIWLRDPRIGIPPTFPYLYLYNKGIPCANEVDVATVAALLILQLLSGKSAIVEFFDMDFENDTVILSHDTNGNPAMAAQEKEVVLTEAPLYTGVYGKGVTCEFLYPEGEVTLLTIAGLPTGWRLIVAEGESVKVEPRSIGAPFLRFKSAGKTLAQFCEEWCRAGATHHMAFAYGNWAKQIKMLAGALGVECAEV